MEEFDMIKSIVDFGKSVFDKIFGSKEKLTKKEVEEIIEKALKSNHLNATEKIKEKVILILQENQEVEYFADGSFSIKSNGADKDRLLHEFIKILISMMQSQYTKLSPIPNFQIEEKKQEKLLPNINTKPDEELSLKERISRIKEKHKNLY